MSAERVQAAPTAVIGLSIEEDGVALSSPTPGDLPQPAAMALASHATVLERDDENELQPLYFVPWIPDIRDSQDRELRADGLRELTARVLTQAMGRVGQARVPTTLTINGIQLLSGATFGVFDRWQDETRKQFSEAAAKIVERALKPDVEIRRERTDCLEIDLPNVDVQETAMKRLEQADPTNQSKNLETVIKELPTLF